MANARLSAPASADFAKTGKMATIAFAAAAILLAMVLLVTVGYLSYRGSQGGGEPDRNTHPEPVKQ